MKVLEKYQWYAPKCQMEILTQVSQFQVLGGLLCYFLPRGQLLCSINNTTACIDTFLKISFPSLLIHCVIAYYEKKTV